MFHQASIVSSNLPVSWTIHFFVTLALLTSDAPNTSWGLTLRLWAEVGAWSNLDVVSLLFGSFYVRSAESGTVSLAKSYRHFIKALNKLVYKAETSSQLVLFWYKKIHFFQQTVPYLYCSEHVRTHWLMCCSLCS